MSYEDVFALFWEQVKESVEEKRFAKLTMAKTIGKPDLKNIFLRPVYSEDGFKVLLKLRYRWKETTDIENEMTLEEACLVLKTHLKNPFFTILLFTITEDVMLKVNKKNVGTIIKNPPTFGEITQAKTDDE